ncbi:aggregation-promoting factor C-terminal-like domain-containing protein [Pengzhenrongella sicca]|uniref:aggregation-promoting factor C-terminal-like domain-containing protein n=1 Tax=Pengzhenrongella sicca TaxID=2819238 RepID=UPI001D0C366C|nr:ubiquitin-like domain-containing protein [Pengzhenrongella sicca]
MRSGSTAPGAPTPAWRPSGRVARLAAQGVVLALVAGGTSAFAMMHKTVTVDVDGTNVEVAAFGRTVGDVLASADITVGDRDLVAPALGESVLDGSEIVVRHGRELSVEVDGAASAVWTTALTVGEAVGELGVRTDAVRVSASRSAPLGRDVLRVSTEKTIHLAVDGQVIDGVTTGSTVREALKEIGLVLQDGDQVSVPLDATAVDGLVVLVTRAQQGSGTTTETVPFTERVVEDPELAEGTRTVTRAGKVGQRETTYATASLGGAEVSRTVLAQVVIDEPVEQVVALGTKVAPVVPDVPAAPDVTPGSAQAIGKELAAARGWGDDEFACLIQLWNHESGWRVNAANSSSGAYGIPQALPGSKMASVGADWQTNPATQITWGLNYIAGRYGTPCGAWSSFEAKGWY